MELSSLKIKKISWGNFPSLKNKKHPLWKKFLYFGKWNFLLHFGRELAKSEKQKFLIFQEMELSSPKIKKKNYIFLKKKFYLIFFIRIFFISILSIRIIRRNVYVFSNKLKCFFFFSNILTFFQKQVRIIVFISSINWINQYYW